MNYQFLNIGCGDSLIDSDLWLNLDYAPIIPTVKKANLLAKLPCQNNSVKLVYSSHFIEHIPYQKVQGFLGECYRVLEKGGVIRLVLPDLEDICREYLKCRQQGEHEKADFCILELLDQCVRMESDGQMGKYWRALKKNQQESTEMIAYIKQRTGEDVPNYRWKHYIDRHNFLNKILEKILQKIQSARILLFTNLLPSAFRQQNVSYTPVGEKHTWMWDFYTLSNQLKSAGFREIQRVSFDNSGIPDFPLVPLDMNPDGTPRKGHSSMYIEACK